MILMGSTYFFNCYEDFKSHDIDFIEVIDTDEFDKKRVIKFKHKDIIQLKRKPKDLIIAEALQEPLALCVGKFLIPEFCNEIGFTIQDLPKVKPLIDRLDSKHYYEKIIYDSYLQNKSFTLTSEQIEKTYKTYKEARDL